VTWLGQEVPPPSIEDAPASASRAPERWTRAEKIMLVGAVINGIFLFFALTDRRFRR